MIHFITNKGNLYHLAPNAIAGGDATPAVPILKHGPVVLGEPVRVLKKGVGNIVHLLVTAPVAVITTPS